MLLGIQLSPEVGEGSGSIHIPPLKSYLWHMLWDSWATKQTQWPIQKKTTSLLSDLAS